MNGRLKIALIPAVILLASGCISKGRVAALQAAPAPASPAQTSPSGVVRKLYTLNAESFWRLELPGGKSFDASGLVLDQAGLLVVSDQDTSLYRVTLNDGNLARLSPMPAFTSAQLKPFLTQKHDRFDFEGLARDDQGRIYVCEEADRWILRWDPVSHAVDRLEIDWSPVRQYFNPINRNASFEGVAVGGGKLWVANERERARIIEIDLETLKITGDFAPYPSSWGLVLHYSDLSWRDGHLFILLRHHRVILEIEPASRIILAEYDYRAVEDAPEHLYVKDYPTGVMEGLAVDDDFFWLVTDNNGYARRADSSDHRPTLFKCRRPEASK